MAIRVFEPALCCNTGICGADVDESLVAFSADLNFLQGESVDIQRHNLANDPAAFVEDDTARQFLETAGSGGLPLTVVNGVTVKTGSYPNREELLAFAGFSTPEMPAASASLLAVASETGCCGSGSCCSS